jgi:hypothetical protein
MNYVYLVQWHSDTCRYAEVFATERGAKAYAATKPKSWRKTMTVHPDEFVGLCFGTSDPAPATIAEMLASSNI